MCQNYRLHLGFAYIKFVQKYCLYFKVDRNSGVSCFLFCKSKYQVFVYDLYELHVMLQRILWVLFQSIITKPHISVHLSIYPSSFKPTCSIIYVSILFSVPYKQYWIQVVWSPHLTIALCSQDIWMWMGYERIVDWNKKETSDIPSLL
jgi:hypothetical protein